MIEGKGWHLEPVRHSRARRFGSAGGKMPSKFNASGVAYSQGTQYWRTPQGKVVRVGSSPLLRAYPKIMAQFNLKKVPEKKMDALIKDEHDASKEYNKLGFPNLAKNEKEHENFLKEVKESQEEIEKDYNAVSKPEYQTHDFNKMVDLTSINDEQAKKLKVGDVVVVPADLTSDPYNKRGEAGVIEEIQPMGKFDPTLKLKFKDGSTGLYDSTSMLYSNSKNKTKVYFVKVGKGSPPQEYNKLSVKEINNLVRKGYAVSRVTTKGDKTQIFTFSPRTREEAIKQEMRLFG